jgi:hypothetical protein
LVASCGPETGDPKNRHQAIAEKFVDRAVVGEYLPT